MISGHMARVLIGTTPRLLVAFVFVAVSGMPVVVQSLDGPIVETYLGDDPPATPTPVPTEPTEKEKEGSEENLLIETEETAGDDLLLGEDDLLTEEWTAEETDEKGENNAYNVHEKLILEDRFPSASTCATCHPKQYREWSVSQHAYAQLSPLMMAMQNVVNVATSTTNGDFCLRCHAPIGSELGEPFSMSNLDRHPASREGITCITCHRIPQAYGKVSGRIAFEEGDIFSPVYGPTGGEELERVLGKRDTYRVVTSAGEPGRAIHTEAKRFFAITTPGFCATCHEVFNVNGFRIEEAFSEYKHSPAAKRGVACNQCHMGTVQGRESEFEVGPAAIVGGVPTKDRRLASHYFAGPDSPIIHPGIFPYNVEAQQFKTMREWLQFDWQAGWGTDEFEDAVPDKFEFPSAWRSIDDRYDAREIIEDQLELLSWAREKRIEVMKNGFALGEIMVKRANHDGLRFEIEVKSATDGHLVPTGFDAERLVWLEVTVADDSGVVVYRSGDRDPNGDLRDTHSRYVRAGLVPRDKALFNLQSKTVTRLVRGGEHEQVLPVNTSVSALPFVRPETRPSILYGRPKGQRKHRQGIEPGGRRIASYRVPKDALTGSSTYTIDVRLRYQAVPVNLIAEIMVVGFDFEMSPREVADAVVEGGEVIWSTKKTITVAGTTVASHDRQHADRPELD
jgi:hypothetical protein